MGLGIGLYFFQVPLIGLFIPIEGAYFSGKLQTAFTKLRTSFCWVGKMVSLIFGHYLSLEIGHVSMKHLLLNTKKRQMGNWPEFPPDVRMPWLTTLSRPGSCRPSRLAPRRRPCGGRTGSRRNPWSGTKLDTGPQLEMDTREAPLVVASIMDTIFRNYFPICARFIRCKR